MLFMNNIRTTISHLLNDAFVQAIGVPSRARLDLRCKLLTMQKLREAPRRKKLSELAYKC
jgi:hypothetical protein